MKRTYTINTAFFLLLILLLSSCSKVTTFTSGDFSFGIDTTGYITNLEYCGKNYLSEAQKSPLVQLYDGKKYFAPTNLTQTSDGNLSVKFENGTGAVISATTKDEYLRFELISINNREGIKAFVWGPYNTTISKWIGETICTVRDKDIAFGVWGLNTVTVEGLPDPENIGGGMFIEPLEGQTLPEKYANRIGDRFPEKFDVVNDIPEYVRIYRGSGARRTQDGSQVRLHAVDHRVIDTLSTITGGPVAIDPIDVDFVGSAVAMFACPNQTVLDVIEKIELQEGLPHPEIDGVWIKRNPKADDAYLMYEGMKLDKALDYADSCGFDRIHIGDAFATWGKFPLETKRFPGGAKDIKAYTDKARKRGKTIGIHSLTMFTTVNDGYVTPKADHHLSSYGKAILSKDISKTDTEIEVDNTIMFVNPTRTKSMRIGNEIMSYESAADGKITGVKRGQFGTEITAHHAGDTVAHLKNNAYNGFYPDIYIEKEYSDRLAAVVNQTGVGLLDLDGFDGGHNGHGQYEMASFAKNWYDSLDHAIYSCASATSHYYWHIYSYMNWGEPWYSELRSSMPRYRSENQRYFERNLMPNMLGWYSINPEFRLEDIEWINARSVGHNAGYLLLLDDNIEKSGIKSEIFNAFRVWQDARRHGVFPEDKIADLQNIAKDFHIEPCDDKGWYLTEITMKRGFSKDSIAVFDNPFLRQPVSFYGFINGGDVTSLTLKIGDAVIKVPFKLHDGDRLFCNGLSLIIADRYWNRKECIETKYIMWEEGANSVTVEYAGNGKATFEMRALGTPVLIKKKSNE